MKEGGYWHGGMPEPNPERTSPSLEDRMKVAAQKLLANITPEKVNQLLPTDDLRNAFRSMKTSTMTMFNLATLEKQQNVLEIREKHISSEEILKNAPTVYIGAGFDIEYPLTLGARNIIMVDPIFRENRNVQEIRKKVEQISSGSFTQDGDSFRFKIDFGVGKEDVTVTLDPRVYTNEEDARVPASDRFVPPDAIGTVVVFQGEDPSRNSKVLHNILPEGLILSNRRLGELVSRNFKGREEEWERFGELSPHEKLEVLRQIYDSEGFEIIPLESIEDDFQRTLVRKKLETMR